MTSLDIERRVAALELRVNGSALDMPKLIRPSKAEKIRAATCCEFGVSFIQLDSYCRTPNLSDARRCAMSLCDLMAGMTLVDVAKLFHKKNHTTVLCAMRRHKTLMDTDPKYRAKVERVMAAITPLSAV